MKLLFITHHYLSSNGGGSFASRAYINAFAEVADEMTLLYPIRKGEDLYDEIDPKIRTIPVANNKSKLQKLFDLFAGKVHRYYKVAPSIIRSGEFEYVVFDTSLVSKELLLLAKMQGCKTIVIHHNFEYEFFRDNLFGIRKWVTLFWCKRYEAEAVCNADVNLTLTREDIRLLQDNYAKDNSSHFELLGVFEFSKVSHQRKSSNKHSQTINRFVITGNLSAVQTEMSIIGWLDDYLPILKSVFPNCELTIAGRNPSSRLLNKCRKLELNIIPSPETMDPIMENADCYICPTCLGGGLKLRVMDGLKWGLPVITHVVSARGYDSFVESGLMFPYANTADFSDSLMKLKQRVFNKQEIHDSYCRLFSFASGVEKIRQILGTL